MANAEKIVLFFRKLKLNHVRAMAAGKLIFPNGFEFIGGGAPDDYSSTYSVAKGLSVHHSVKPLWRVGTAVTIGAALRQAFETLLTDPMLWECVAFALLQFLRDKHKDAYGALLVNAFSGRSCHIDIAAEDGTVRRIAVPVAEVLSPRRWNNILALNKICAPVCPSPLNRVLVSAISETYLCAETEQSPWFCAMIMYDMLRA
ncbi:MAG: hypothetical protein LBB38_01725 [Puniceicoccales bacterium]|nr:hypothetical protein [Puniceicoccales bacterium]